MPPRRTLKKRATRMDAAVDAMLPMGFPKPLVRTAVNNLLKVYGPEGWVFIEGDAYKVLIEALLGEGDQNQTNGSAKDDQMEDNQGDSHNEASTSGCSNRTLLPCTNAETFTEAILTNQVFDTASASGQPGNKKLSIRAADSVLAIVESGNQLPVMSVDTPLANVEPLNQLSAINAVDVMSANYEFDCETANSPRDAPQPVKKCKIAMPPPHLKVPKLEAKSSTANSPIDVPQPVKKCKIAMSPPQLKVPKLEAKSSTANSLPPPPLPAPQPVKRVGRQTRRPCYGWISDDDADDDDDEEEETKLIELPPASLSQVLSMFVNGNGGEK